MATRKSDPQSEITALRARIRELEETLRPRPEQARPHVDLAVTTLDSLTEWVHVVGPDLRVVLMNRPFRTVARSVGYEGDPVGASIRELFPFLDDDVLEEYRSVFRTGHALVTQESHQVAGRLIHTQTTKSPMLENTTIIRVVTVVRDITARAEAEEALHGLYQELETRVQVRTAELSAANVALRSEIAERQRAEAQARRLEAQMYQARKLESLGVLAGGIAHDFNNLLVNVLNNAELVHARLIDDSWSRDRLSDIEAAAQSAADLCRQLLAYAGKGSFVVRPIDLSRVIEETSRLVLVPVSARTTVTYRLARGLPAVEADPSQIQQVVMNLVTNAAEALEGMAGSIDISTGVALCDGEYLASCHPRADGMPEGPYAYLEVADTGCGMDETTRERMFEPLFSTKFAGRGLGMAAVLGIVLSQRGAVRIASAPGKGTTIRVHLPISSSPIEDPVPDHVPAVPAPLSGTVLVVDDEPAVCRMASHLLEEFGLRVITASGGREALEILETRPDPIRCILLDLTMPGMDGDETLRELHRVRPDLPVVICSGYTEQVVSPRFEGLAVAGFLHKPYRMEKLRTLLATILAK